MIPSTSVGEVWRPLETELRNQLKKSTVARGMLHRFSVKIPCSWATFAKDMLVVWGQHESHDLVVFEQHQQKVTWYLYDLALLEHLRPVDNHGAKPWRFAPRVHDAAGCLVAGCNHGDFNCVTVPVEVEMASWPKPTNSKLIQVDWTMMACELKFRMVTCAQLASLPPTRTAKPELGAPPMETQVVSLSAAPVAASSSSSPPPPASSSSSSSSSSSWSGGMLTIQKGAE